MRPRSSRCLSAALAACVLLSATAQAQVIPFGGNFGPGLSPEDNQLLFESVARLNAAEPSQVGRSEVWSNPQTKTSGTSEILRVFRSGGMVCHLMRHHIVVVGRTPARDYRLTWCRTSTGEWKIKA
jgi:surface antigen